MSDPSDARRDPGPDPAPEPGPEPALEPGDEARLRALLARARGEEPMPADVAARLDRVVAELGAADRDPVNDPNDPNRPDAPLDLAARRRRVTRGLVAAAAAVVVLGVGATVVHHTSSSDGSDASSPDAAAAQPNPDRPGDHADAGSPDANGSFAPSTKQSGGLPAAPAPQRTSDGAAGAGGTGGADELASRSGLPVITDRGFSRQVRRLVRGGSAPTSADRDVEAALPARCRSTGRAAQRIAVSYRGAPALLLVRTRAGSARTVDLVGCGSTRVLRSVTLAR